MSLGSVIKQYRLTRGLSQLELAEAADTTQQSVARWETDKARPRVHSLAKIAEALSVSVELLFHLSGDKDFPELTDDKKNFWGHIGLECQKHTWTWFPISEGEADRIWYLSQKANADWIIFDTLNNRSIALNQRAINSYQLVDQNAEAMFGWSLPDDGYDGNPPEVYKCLAAMDIDPASMKDFPEDTQADALRLWGKLNLDDGERFSNFLYQTHVHFVDGDKISLGLDPKELRFLLFMLEADPGTNTTIRLQEIEAPSYLFVRAERIAAIDIPYTQLEDANEAELDE